MTAEAFSGALRAVLLERYAGHWYPDDPMRGHAYRSISCESRPDAVLEAAAHKVRLPHVLQSLPRSVCMFVNPGAVRVRVNGDIVTVFCKEA